MRFYHYTIVFDNEHESGHVLSQGDKARAFELIVSLYGAEVELVQLTEVTYEQYKRNQNEKYETPNTKHMQDIPSNIPGWKVRDN